MQKRIFRIIIIIKISHLSKLTHHFPICLYCFAEINKLKANQAKGESVSRFTEQWGATGRSGATGTDKDGLDGLSVHWVGLSAPLAKNPTLTMPPQLIVPLKTDEGIVKVEDLSRAQLTFSEPCLSKVPRTWTLDWRPSPRSYFQPVPVEKGRGNSFPHNVIQQCHSKLERGELDGKGWSTGERRHLMLPLLTQPTGLGTLSALPGP